MRLLGSRTPHVLGTVAQSEQLSNRIASGIDYLRARKRLMSDTHTGWLGVYVLAFKLTPELWSPTQWLNQVILASIIDG